MLTVSISKLIKILVYILIFLVLANLSVLYLYYNNIFPSDTLVDFFNFDAESNIPTFFSSFLILVNCLFFYLIGREKLSRYWFVLGGAFFYVAVDEIVQIHEFLMDIMKNYYEFSGIFYFCWIIPGTLLVVVLFFVSLKFLLNLDPRTRKIFIFAGAVYFLGAVGFEALGGYYVSNHGQENFSYSMITTAEEFLEMSGMIIFMYALLDHIKRFHPDINVKFSK